eukprot:EG_transcript_2287
MSGQLSVVSGSRCPSMPAPTTGTPAVNVDGRRAQVRPRTALIGSSRVRPLAGGEKAFPLPRSYSLIFTADPPTPPALALGNHHRPPPFSSLCDDALERTASDWSDSLKETVPAGSSTPDSVPGSLSIVQDCWTRESSAGSSGSQRSLKAVRFQLPLEGPALNAPAPRLVTSAGSAPRPLPRMQFCGSAAAGVRLLRKHRGLPPLSTTPSPHSEPLESRTSP